MKDYKILGWNKNKELIADGKFIASDVFTAVKRFIHELTYNLEVEQGDLFHLIDDETGELINYIKF